MGKESKRISKNLERAVLPDIEKIISQGKKLIKFLGEKRNG